MRSCDVVITTASERRTRSDLNAEYPQTNSQTRKVTSELGPSPCKIFPKPQSMTPLPQDGEIIHLEEVPVAQ